MERLAQMLLYGFANEARSNYQRLQLRWASLAVSMRFETASDGYRDYVRWSTYMRDRGFNKGLGLQAVRLHETAKSCKIVPDADKN